MTKQELEKAIENDECVWYSSSDKVVKIDLSKKNKYDIQECSIFNDNYKITELVINYTLHYLLKYLFKTKAEAEHYLHHANISRTEHLPFLTWEEFKEGKELRFYNGKYRYKMNWSVDPEIIVIKRYLDFGIDEFIFNERLTESNFYKAYDECVKLFKQE